MLYSKIEKRLERGRLAVSKNKALISGIAIILVILYHSNPHGCYPGFIGVDFFMFLSGYFLCRSYEQHSLKEFYKRRFCRIFPMFLLLAVSIILIKVLAKDYEMSLFDVFCTCTTLSYYNVGGIFVDWYLSSLFILYLLFPLLYRLMGSKCSLIILTVSMVAVVIMFSMVDIDWKYEAAIGRLPIYCMGILAYFELSKGEGNGSIRYALFSIPILILTAILFIKHTYIQEYTLVYAIAPMALYILGVLISRANGLSNSRLWGGYKRLANIPWKYMLEM